MSRLKLLGKLHIAKKQMGLTDETYRAVLENLFEKRSAKELSDQQIVSAIRHFQRLGFTPRASPREKKFDDQRGDIYSATPAQKRMIEAMWHDVYRGNSETNDLRKFLFNHYKITDLRFATKDIAHRCIERLKSFKTRRDPHGKMV